MLFFKAKDKWLTSVSPPYDQVLTVLQYDFYSAQMCSLLNVLFLFNLLSIKKSDEVSNVFLHNKMTLLLVVS